MQTIFTTILREAVRVEGSTQGLASRLHAPEPTLLRWMDGRAQIPLRAFRATLEFLMSEERKAAPGPAGWPSLSTGPVDKLVFSAGTVFAHCARCRSTEFRLTGGAALRLTSSLACNVCDAEVVHGELLAHLAANAVHQSRAVAARLRFAAPGKARGIATQADG